MFRTYRQANTAGQYLFLFDVTKNTFAATNSMVLQILWIGTVGASDSTIEFFSIRSCQVSQQTGHLT
jgi:hypothetical protein